MKSVADYGTQPAVFTTQAANEASATVRRMIKCIAPALGAADGAVDQRRSSAPYPGYTIGAATGGDPP